MEAAPLLNMNPGLCTLWRWLLHELTGSPGQLTDKSKWSVMIGQRGDRIFFPSHQRENYHNHSGRQTNQLNWILFCLNIRFDENFRQLVRKCRNIAFVLQKIVLETKLLKFWPGPLAWGPNVNHLIWPIMKPYVITARAAHQCSTAQHTTQCYTSLGSSTAVLDRMITEGSYLNCVVRS